MLRKVCAFIVWVLVGSSLGQWVPLQRLRVLVAPAPLISHWLPMMNIIFELAARGHEFKVLYAAEEEYCADQLNVPKDARISFANTSPSDKLMKEWMKLIQEGRQTEFASLLPIYVDYVRGAISSPDSITRVKEWQPDVVLIEGAFPTGGPLADLLGIPKVIFQIFGPLGPVNTGGVLTPDAPSLMPPFTSWQKQPMNFAARLKNAYNWGLNYLLFNAWHDAFSTLWTNYGMPHMSYRESIRQAAAVIFSSHFAIIPAIPMSPHAHVLGSLTATPAKPLPQALAVLCAASPDGIIYMSYGTSAIPDVKLMSGINQAIEQLRVPVIWKLTQHDQDVLSQQNVTVSKNAHLTTYAPQNDLLGSGCLRGFVTQGGSNSYLEAVHHGVPMVILPLLVEQPFNAAQAAALGFGIHVDLAMPVEPAAVTRKLGAALRQLLADGSYAVRAQHFSRILQAERWTPVQQGASIVEHVGWTNGSMHRHFLQHNTSWIALHMLGVIIVLASGVLAFVGLAVYAAIYLAQIVRRRTGPAYKQRAKHD